MKLWFWSMLAGCVVLLPGPDVQAQAQAGRNFLTGMGWGVGYSGAIPHAELGLGAFHFVKRIGIFADVKLTTGSLQDHAYFCPATIATCDSSWVLDERNDLHVRTKGEWLIFNAGAAYGVTRELAVLLGAGAARERRYDEFFDDSDEEDGQRVTPDGNYYVPDAGNSGWRMQLVAGAMFRAGRRLAFRFGYETAVKGASIGIYLIP